jgi:hypothetical protein
MTEIAELLGKTPSACSQIVRKLRKKEMVVQVRDELNNRRFRLLLTELGEKVYEGHQLFTKECKDYFTECLEEFSEETLEHFLDVQRKINQSYERDIKKGSAVFPVPGFYQDLKKK